MKLCAMVFFSRSVILVSSGMPLSVRWMRLAFVANNKNIELFRKKKLTSAVAAKVQRLCIRQLLPDQTPAGLLIDEATKDNFMQQQLEDSHAGVPRP
jgi:hypothetical protein